MAELIVIRNGLPETYEPFLPLGGFGSFPLGFHALAAVETLLGGIPTYRSTIHVLCFSLAALTFTLAALLRSLGIGRAGAALGAAGALVLGRNPQFFERWGGGPTLLAAALVYLVLRDGLRFAESCSPGFLARVGVLSAGVLLTHQLPVASFLYVFPVAVALRAGRNRRALLNLARNGAIVLALSCALSIPFLQRAPRSASPEATAWARDWFRRETLTALQRQATALHTLGAGLATHPGPQTWPFYLNNYLGAPAAILLVLGLAICWLRARGPATTLATGLVAVHIVLFAGAVTATLPLWPSLYPTRIGIWLAPALAVALAGLGSLGVASAGRRSLLVAGILWLGLFAMEGLRLSSADRFGSFYYGPDQAVHNPFVRILANDAVGGAFWVAALYRGTASVTSDDLQAFCWIRDHTATGTVFATNDSDGGRLIAAVAHRAVINAHFNLIMFYQRDVDEWRRRTPIDYIYVSPKALPDMPMAYTAEALDRDLGVQLVFRAGEARVYKVTQPVPVEQLGFVEHSP
jgi:hypothetical protein